MNERKLSPEDAYRELVQLNKDYNTAFYMTSDTTRGDGTETSDPTAEALREKYRNRMYDFMLDHPESVEKARSIYEDGRDNNLIDLTTWQRAQDVYLSYVQMPSSYSAERAARNNAVTEVPKHEHMHYPSDHYNAEPVADGDER